MTHIKCCKSCDSRYLGCHDECVDYIREKEVGEKAKKEKAKNGEYLSYVIETAHERKKKWKGNKA